MQTRKYKGGSSTLKLRVGRRTLIKKSKPSILDGRTCYQVGPLKWCNRKQKK